MSKRRERGRDRSPQRRPRSRSDSLSASPSRSRSRSRGRSRSRSRSRSDSRHRGGSRQWKGGRPPSRQQEDRRGLPSSSSASASLSSGGSAGPAWLRDLLKKRLEDEKKAAVAAAAKRADEEAEEEEEEGALDGRRTRNASVLTPPRFRNGTVRNTPSPSAGANGRRASPSSSPSGAASPSILDDPDVDIVMRDTPSSSSRVSPGKARAAATASQQRVLPSGRKGGDAETSVPSSSIDSKSPAQASQKPGGQFESSVVREAERLSSLPASISQQHIPSLMGCRSVHSYKRLNTIGGGTYGVVHRAEDNETKEVVALKKIKMDKAVGGFPITSLREVNIMLNLEHPNVLNVREIVLGEELDNIYMVMDFMEHDLKVLMDNMKQPFGQSEVKCLMLQLLSGVKAMHDAWVIHRDLKTSNLLLNNRGTLKICDFGLARRYGSPIGKYTPLVVTLWYRAPELLLGTDTYTPAIDMWSVGCIFAEMLTREPLFPGKGELDQLHKIVEALGAPSDENWPGFSNLAHAKTWKFKKTTPKLRQKFPKVNYTGGVYLTDTGFDLLKGLLTYDPQQRLTADQALEHPWFKEAPRPQDPRLMPSFPSHFEGKRRERSPDLRNAREEESEGFFLA